MDYHDKKKVSQFGIFSNDDIKIFVDKYLTTYQTIKKSEFHNVQIRQHK